MDVLKEIQHWHKMAQAGSPLKNELLPVKIDQALNLIKEEVDEMLEAHDNDNLLHAAHEAADVIFTVVNFIHLLGYDAESVVREITRANYKKIIDAELAYYDYLNIAQYQEEKNASVRSVGGGHYAMYGDSGKMKKGPYYEKPDYSKFEKL